jgi:hypothetical protein
VNCEVLCGSHPCQGGMYICSGVCYCLVPILVVKWFDAMWFGRWVPTSDNGSGRFL